MDVLVYKLSFLAFLQAFALWSVAGSVGEYAKRLGSGLLVSGMIVPWLTTLPETIVTIKLASSGYPIAGLYNCVMSAVFDLFLIAPLIGYKGKERLAPAVFAPVPLLLLAMVHYEGGKAVLEQAVEGVALLAIMFALSLAASYGPATFNISFQGVLELLAALSALGFASIEFSNTVTALTAAIGSERLGGTLAAILTSLPDAIYAVRAGLKGSVEEAMAEISGCIIHDFLEAPAIAMIFSKLILYAQDILLLLAYTIAATVFVAVGRGRQKMVGAILFTAFLLAGIL